MTAEMTPAERNAGDVEALVRVLDEHLPGDYTHLFYDDPGTIDPPVGCRCGWRRERGVSHHMHVAHLLAAHDAEVRRETAERAWNEGWFAGLADAHDGAEMPRTNPYAREEASRG